MLNFSRLKGFDWNKWNVDKNWIKHKVSIKECEEIFFDKSKKILNDLLHSSREKRYIILGKTLKKRLLYAVFTVRRNKIRIISARDINKKEIKLYEKKT